MDLKTQPVMRVSAPHLQSLWTPEDADDRYRARHVVLTQSARPSVVETHARAIKTVDIGIYHDSFGIDGKTQKYYPSGAYREERTALYIPLEDRVTLTAIRDLLNRALETEPD